MEFGHDVISGAFGSSKRILLGGAGGGFDVYCALPLFFALSKAGKHVVLANSSFSALNSVSGIRPHPCCLRVVAGMEHPLDYFPELHLCEWFKTQLGMEISVYAFEQSGVKPLTQAYAAVIEAEQIDTIVLVDGGVDAVLRGDESGLGTPAEDLASLTAVASLTLDRKYLVCTAFGVDSFHGVAHADFLSAVATLTRRRAYLGAISLLPGMEASDHFRAAVEFAHQATPAHQSTVCLSMLRALQGHAGYEDVKAGTSVWINPLMNVYWLFDLQAVFERHLFAANLAKTNSFSDVVESIQAARARITPEERSVIPV
jgi:hypothetical protein